MKAWYFIMVVTVRAKGKFTNRWSDSNRGGGVLMTQVPSVYR